jgi:hypothetical protein
MSVRQNRSICFRCKKKRYRKYLEEYDFKNVRGKLYPIYLCKLGYGCEMTSTIRNEEWQRKKRNQDK